MNRSNSYRSPNRSSFESRRGASRPQGRRHSSRNEEDVSRANAYETDRFGSSSSRRGQRFESDQKQYFEEDLSHDRDGRSSRYQGDDDPAEGRRSSEPRRGNQDYRNERDSRENRYSQWNRPSYTSNGRHFERQRDSFAHYDDPRSSGSRYSPMEDERWQDDLDLDAYEYRIEDDDRRSERVHHRSSMNRDDRPAHNRSRYSNRDQNYASHNRSRGRRF